MKQTEQQLKSQALRQRLGDFLLNEALVTSEQLDEAVEYQCIYGGKLGTSLIELGLVEEDQIAKALSRQLKLHYVKPDLLMKVPAEIIRLVPKDIALRYQVVPYRRDGKKLFLAMKDTSNLAIIDELAFALDHIIIPLAIPEIRLFLALKKHYGLNLSPRFNSLESQINYRSKMTAKAASKKKQQPQEDQQEETVSWPLLGDEDSIGDPAADEAYFGLHTPQEKILQTSLGQQLAEAKDRNDIGKALINHLSNEFSACGLFMVRDTIVSGWLGRSGTTELKDFDQLNIPLHEPSIFNLVVSSKTHILGPVIDTAQNRKLLAAFASNSPQTALVLPLLVRNRLVSILYIQDSVVTLEKRFSELKRLASKAEMTFTLLILKNKILTT